MRIQDIKDQVKKEDPNKIIDEISNKPSEENLIKLCNESDIIFIGTLRFIGESPTHMSGSGGPAFHMVVYYVEIGDILKSNYYYRISEIPVVYLIVGGKIAPDSLSLSSSIFRVGNQLIVFAETTERVDELLTTTPDEFIKHDKILRFPMCLDKNYGSIPYSKELGNSIVDILKKSGTLAPLYDRNSGDAIPDGRHALPNSKK